MRILHLIESLEFGGAEKVAIDLANEMAREHEITLCCVKMIGDLGASVDPRIRVLCLDKKEGNDYFLPVRLARLLRESRIEVLHAHNWGVFLEAALAGLLARTPVCIHTVHGPYMDYAAGWTSSVKRTLRHRLEQLLAPRFFNVVTVSDSIQQYIRDEIGIPASRMVTVHNGIRVDGPSPVEKREKRVVCSTVGRLAAIKNQAMMIRAFNLLERDAGKDIVLRLVGDGPERAALESLVRELNMTDRVEFIGFRHDVAELLAQSDIFVMSSNYEGVSIAVLEAMRAGLPVIGTQVGGMAETVKPDTGILVAPGDDIALAAALQSLVDSADLRKQMGDAGRKFLQAEFSIQNMVARYEQLYKGKTA